MKKFILLVLLCLWMIALVACSFVQNSPDEVIPSAEFEPVLPSDEPKEEPQTAQTEPVLSETVVQPGEQESMDFTTAQPNDVPEELEQEEQPMDTAKRIRFLVGEDEIVVRLEDNPAAESLYAMLPMELNFEDYNNTEKIAYPDETLTTNGAPDRCTPQRGDLCFYAPWGNLCFFYRDFRESPSLVPLGTVESGMEYLESLNTVASVTAEAVG